MKGILRMSGWLVMTAALMAGISACNTADKLQPEDEESAVDAPKTYTLTVTATKGEDDATRALTLSGKTLNATWTAGDKVTVYKDMGGGMSQEYGTLKATNVSEDGLTCTLTGEISPAPKVGDELTLRYHGGGYGSQEGTLEYIANYCDIAIATVTVTVVEFGEITTTEADFVSQQAIVKFTLKRPDGTTPFAATSLNVKYGKTTYKVRPGVAMSELFVAIPGSSGATVSLVASDGTDIYGYTKTGVTFANGQYYAIGVTMKDGTVDLAAATGDVALKDGDVAYGTLAGNYRVSIASGAEVALNGVNIPGAEGEANNWAGIKCDGNATINLFGTNTVRAYGDVYPGIYIRSGKTLTIQGDGVLNVSASDGAAIGGGSDFLTATSFDCGNIVIKGGTITATGGSKSAGIGAADRSSCGDITISGSTVTATGGHSGAGIGTGKYGTCGIISISGGSVTATGGENGAGIGSGLCGNCGNISISGGSVTATGGDYAAGVGTGDTGTCGNITITDKVTSVTANKGSDATYTIGKSRHNFTSGTVKIGGTIYYDGSSFQNDGGDYLRASPFIYQP